MNLDLGSKIKAYCDRDQVHIIPEHQLIINADGNLNSCSRLEQLILSRLKQINTVSNQTDQKLNIIVAESEAIAFLATFMAGVIEETNLFLCNPNWQQQEWQQVINLVKPDLLFAPPKVKALIENLIPGKSTTVRLDNSDTEQQSWIAIPTGGSSGKIKFALHTWSSLTASAQGFQSYFNCSTVNSFCTLPLYHVSGLMQFIRSFTTQGNFLVCPYRVLKTQKINGDRQEWFISLVPTQLKLLMELMPNWLAEFKTILLGGAPASPELLAQARKHRLPLAPCYGMTETASQVVTLKPEAFLAGNNSSGLVLPHAQITIQPESKPDSTSKVGLIQISSTALCLGYYPPTLAQQNRTAKNIFTTDDLGYFDDAGYLHIVGRNSQKIITGGENVFPGEVEAAILATKLVLDVCVVGISDRHWGEAVTAVYVPLERDLSTKVISDRLQLSLAKYKQPKHWISVTSLERNDRGKVDYPKIKAIAARSIEH